MLYLYANNAKFERELSSTEYVHAEFVPDDAKEDEYSIQKLSELKVLPRDEMHNTDFDIECGDTE